MEVTLSENQLNAIYANLNNIFSIIGYAEGQAQSYEAKREELKIIDFEKEKTKAQKNPVEDDGIAYFPGIKSDSEVKTRAEVPFYSEEEIKRLPKLKYGRFRITKDGLHQIRYRRDGYDKQFTAKDLKKVKEAFREWVKSVNDEKKEQLPKKTQSFAEIAEWYFSNVKSVNVDEGTCKSQHRTMELHILPKIGNIPIRQITSTHCQELLKGILESGKGRTAETVKFILGQVFRSAVGDKIIASNPMKYVKIPNHIRENGKNIPIENVHNFMKACEKSPYRKQYMVYLYTGIRRNEIHSMKIEGNFISVICGKCKKGEKPRRRKIPISDFLRPFLPLSVEELAVKNDVFTKRFTKLCKGYTLNDLRHTFITHAQECGIPKVLVDIWTDHIDKKDMTEGVYTHFSEEFQLKEMAKLKF